MSMKEIALDSEAENDPLLEQSGDVSRAESTPHDEVSDPGEGTDREDEDVDAVDGDDDDENGDSEDDDGEDEEEEMQVESLVAGREKRFNAGNRMATAILQQGPADADEDEQFNEYFANGLDDDDEFEHQDVALDDDDDDDSSDDEDKQGPEDELAGEKELQQQERAQKSAQKRKAPRGMPAPIRKRVKIQAPTADEDEEARLKRRKKSDRLSWTQSAVDKPVRVSSRTLSVQNKSKTLANMEESSKRAEVTRQKMRISEAKKKATEKPPMTQKDRLAEAARVEKINKKSVHRWEEQEQERQERQRAELERLRNKKLEGPVIRWYSGPAEFVPVAIKDGPGFRVRTIGRPKEIESGPEPEVNETRLEAAEDGTKPLAGNGSSGTSPSAQEVDKCDSELNARPANPADPTEQEPEGVEELNERQDATTVGPRNENTDASRTGEVGMGQPNDQPTTQSAQDIHPVVTADEKPSLDGPRAGHAVDTATSSQGEKQAGPAIPPAHPSTAPGDVDFLAGIEVYANLDSQPVHADRPSQKKQGEFTSRSAQQQHADQPLGDHSLGSATQARQQQPMHPESATQDLDKSQPHNSPDIVLAAFAPRSGVAASTAPQVAHPLTSVFSAKPYASNKPLTGATAMGTESTAPIPQPHIGQAQSITLVNFSDSLGKHPDAIRRIMFGTHYTPPEKTKMSTTKQKRAPPECVITSHPAKYRDPVTGLGFASVEAYGMLRTLVNGLKLEEGVAGSQTIPIPTKAKKQEEQMPIRWSPMLNAWMGKADLAAMGAPPGFLYGTTPAPAAASASASVPTSAPAAGAAAGSAPQGEPAKTAAPAQARTDSVAQPAAAAKNQGGAAETAVGGAGGFTGGSTSASVGGNQAAPGTGPLATTPAAGPASGSTAAAVKSES